MARTHLGGGRGTRAKGAKGAKDAKVKGMEDDEIAGVVVGWRFAWRRNWGGAAEELDDQGMD